MCILHGTYAGVSTGTVTNLYSKCIGRGVGTMRVYTIEMYKNVILQTQPDLAAWHASVIHDMNTQKMFPYDYIHFVFGFSALSRNVTFAKT